MKNKLFNKIKTYIKTKKVYERSLKQNEKIAHQLIGKVFPDDLDKLVSLEPIHDGYTNISFLAVFANGGKYQIRIPHDGKIINRKTEYDIHKNYLKTNVFIYFDIKTGAAVKKWLPGECPSKFVYKSERFTEKLFKKIKQLHEIQPKKDNKFKVLKFDAYNENLYRLKFIYKKKFLCLIDRRSTDKQVLSHTDINPLNIIYNKENDSIRLIDFEWAGLANEYFDYANYIRETDIDYKKVEWSKYIENFNMERLEQYLFMSSMYSFLWTYAMPETPKILRYRTVTYKQIKKYYPAVITVDKNDYIGQEDEK